MKKTHSQIWAYLKTNMLKRWNACRHECSATVGTPDISFACLGTHGWIELKSIEKWPKERERLRDLTIHQVRWLERRGKAGNGGCFLLLSVGEDWLLFPHFQLNDLFYDGVGPKEKYSKVQFPVLWEKTIPWDEFMTIISAREQ